MDFIKLCKNRYSVRKFSDKKVEEEKINHNKFKSYTQKLA